MSAAPPGSGGVAQLRITGQNGEPVPPSLPTDFFVDSMLMTGASQVGECQCDAQGDPQNYEAVYCEPPLAPTPSQPGTRWECADLSQDVATTVILRRSGDTWSPVLSRWGTWYQDLARRKQVNPGVKVPSLKVEVKSPDSSSQMTFREVSIVKWSMDSPDSRGMVETLEVRVNRIEMA